MDSFKIKIKSFWQRTRMATPFFGLSKKNIVNQIEVDKKLVYSLSVRKIPTSNQIKYLKKFLNPLEILIIKICLAVIVVNAIYLGFLFVKKYLQYTPAQGGEYIEGVVGYPQTINPIYSTNRDIDNDLSRLIYSSLFKYDQNGHLINDLAEKITINDNSLEYIVKIKNNVKWHNGSSLTADDIVFTVGLIQNPKYRSPLRFALSGVEINKVDDLTVKFVLTEPYAPFQELLTFGILSKNIWENVSPEAAVLSDLNMRPIGSGPFKFKSLVKNTEGDLKDYRLVVNNDYYGQKPYLNSIDFKFFVDYAEEIKALNDNQINGLSYLPFSSKKDLLAQNSLNFHDLIQSQIVSLFFNDNKNKTLANKNIRVALANALDKDQIIKDVFAGVVKRADGPILSENFAYNKALVKYNYFPEKAVNTLKVNPLTAKLTVIDSGNNVEVAQKIQAYWEAVGCKISLNIVSGEQAIDIIKNRDFEILLYGESVGGDPDVYAFWHSSQIGDKGLNLASYSNPAVDKLLVDARETTNQDDRVAKYGKFQEIITNDLPAIFLYSPAYTYVQAKKIQGFTGTTIIQPADRFNGVGDWFIKTKKKLAW